MLQFSMNVLLMANWAVIMTVMVLLSGIDLSQSDQTELLKAVIGGFPGGVFGAFGAFILAIMLREVEVALGLFITARKDGTSFRAAYEHFNKSLRES